MNAVAIAIRPVGSTFSRVVITPLAHANLSLLVAVLVQDFLIDPIPSISSFSTSKLSGLTLSLLSALSNSEFPIFSQVSCNNFSISPLIFSLDFTFGLLPHFLNNPLPCFEVFPNFLNKCQSFFYRFSSCFDQSFQS